MADIARHTDTAGRHPVPVLQACRHQVCTHYGLAVVRVLKHPACLQVDKAKADDAKSGKASKASAASSSTAAPVSNGPYKASSQPDVSSPAPAQPAAKAASQATQNAAAPADAAVPKEAAKKVCLSQFSCLHLQHMLKRTRTVHQGRGGKIQK